MSNKNAAEQLSLQSQRRGVISDRTLRNILRNIERRLEE